MQLSIVWKTRRNYEREKMSVNLNEMVSAAVRAGNIYNLNHFHQAWEDPSLRRLMGNELLYPPSPHVIEAVRDILPFMNYYPEDAGTNERLRTALSEYVGLPGKADWVTLGNGSMEIIDMVPRAFLDAGDEVLLPCPDYSPYTRRPLLYGGKVVDVVPSGQDFQYDLKDFTSHITARTKMAIITRPNAPVGNMVSKELIEGLLATGIVVVVDEAYAEFSSQTLCGMLPQHNNLIVSRTFSKAMGLGGIRLGFLLAQPEMIGIIERIRVPLNVSLLTQVAALAALEDAEWIRKNTDKVIETRDRFFENVDRIPGIKAYPSEGNFVLINCEGTGKKAAQFERYLFEHGFLVRSFSNSRGLPGEYFFRITVGTEEDMIAVNALISEFAGS